MFRAAAVVDAVARAQIVEPVGAGRMLAARQQQRVDQPFAREIIATTTRNGGFPPLLLEPVDFVGLYRQKMSEMQPAGAVAPQS